MYDGFTAHEPDDLCIEIDLGGGYGEGGSHNVFLKEAIDAQTEQTEKYLCEANAKDYYAGICVLELLASDMRRKYDEWKNNDFQKSKGS